MKDEKSLAQLLDEAFEATRQAWNAQPENREKLGDRLNEIREAQYDEAAKTDDDDEPTESNFRNC